MALQKEVWVQDIQEKLFANNDFISKSVSHDAFVDSLTVHVPQAGSIPAVQVNRAILPAAISERTDTDESYNLQEFTTDPILVRRLDEIQTSYAKRSSVMQNHINVLNDRMGLEALYQWAGSALVSATNGQIVLTTGTATANIGPAGTTGNRKALGIEDLAAAAAKLDGDDVAQENRFLVMPAKVYHSMLVENPELLNGDYMNKGNLPEAVVMKVWGFNIMVRSNTVSYADAATPTKKAIGAAVAVTDHFGCVGFQSDYVAKALGSIEVFANNAQADYYGDILSARVDFAAKALRTDGKGIVTIVQDS